MSAVSVRISNLGALSRAFKRMPDAARLFVGAFARLAAEEMRDAAPSGTQHLHPLSTRAPKRKGVHDLKSSIRVLDFTPAGLDTEAVVGSAGIGHAKYVVDGTQPHLIDHRRAKALTIFDPGSPYADEYGFTFFKYVHHDGTAPNDFRAHGIEEADKGKAELWTQALRDAGIHEGAVVQEPPEIDTSGVE